MHRDSAKSAKLPVPSEHEEQGALISLGRLDGESILGAAPTPHDSEWRPPGVNGVPCSLFAWRRFPTPENREALIAGRSRRGCQEFINRLLTHLPCILLGFQAVVRNSILAACSSALCCFTTSERFAYCVRRFGADHGNATWVSARGGTAGKWISTLLPDRGTQKRYVIFPTGRRRPRSDVD